MLASGEFTPGDRAPTEYPILDLSKVCVATSPTGFAKGPGSAIGELLSTAGCKFIRLNAALFALFGNGIGMCVAIGKGDMGIA